MKSPIYDRILRGLVWVATFCLAAGVYLSLSLMFRRFPPTEPVAVGLVTILGYSKVRDYFLLALFLLLTPPLAVWLHPRLLRLARREATMPRAVAFLLPWLLAPFLYLTTGKAGWILILPAVLSFALPRAIAFYQQRLWLRQLLSRANAPWHALLLATGIGWLFYRYLCIGRRIAHIPTLFLEVVFVAVFLLLFWTVAILVARLGEMHFAADPQETFRRVAFASFPIALLPFMAAIWPPFPQPRLAMAVALVLVALLAWKLPRIPSGVVTWRLSAWLLMPALVYLYSFGSTAEHTQWIDLFHRGEAVGPASDYLRGKVPFRDVFALHGMLEDGLLDAWLMQLFGRSIEVAMWRTVVLGAFLGVAIWYLGLALFRSVPLALLCVAMGSWTTAENNRTLFQIAAVALFWMALSRRSRTAAVFSGVFAGVALFFSYEIGLYTIAGAFAVALLLWIASRRVPWNGLPPITALVWFVVGTVLGCAPFAIYLAAHGALDDFFVTSFVTIPRIIDAVWALPFPDIVGTFRKDFNLQALADFILWEKFHLIVSPLTIAIATTYYIARWLRRTTDEFDNALLVLTVFSTIAQRSAMGRAEFRHQYFAAFLIGPLLVLLAILLLRQVRAAWRSSDAGGRAFFAGAGAVAIVVIAILFWIPDLVFVRLQDFTRYAARRIHIDRDAKAEAVQWRIREVSTALQELTPRGEPIFDFSNQPAFYFFADRPNPTRFYQVPILSPRELQEETIRALEKARPPVVIRRSPELYDRFDGIPNEVRTQALAAYLDELYEFHKIVRGVELWTRRKGTRAAPIAQYLARVRIPKPEEVHGGQEARMIFPIVGSVSGLNDSYWQSELMLHNPYRDPLPVHLRLITGETGSDRTIRLAPRQTFRWADVTADLFGRRGHVGTLWLTHPEAKPPVAVVKTSDVAHGGRASVERPLTMADSATSGTGHAELAIIGVPSAPPQTRRVNVGVVNVGIIPATFRIEVQSRNGQRVGGTMETGVPEAQVWIVNDVERQLGVQLDETTSVRITVIAGTGVAYAAVVDSKGDSEFLSATPSETTEPAR